MENKSSSIAHVMEKGYPYKIKWRTGDIGLLSGYREIEQENGEKVREGEYLYFDRFGNSRFLFHRLADIYKAEDTGDLKVLLRYTYKDCVRVRYNRKEKSFEVEIINLNDSEGWKIVNTFPTDLVFSVLMAVNVYVSKGYTYVVR